MVFKLFNLFFLYLYVLFVLVSPLFLLVGVLLIWKGSGRVRGLGWLLLLLVAYYQLSWISPWYVIQGSERVQEFKLNDIRFGPSASVKWIEDSNRLLILRDEDEVYKPEEYKYALVVDLEARQTYWQPIAGVNLDATRKVESLRTGYGERRDGLSIYYASPSKQGPRVESSFFGFSLPILGYQIPFPFGEISGWQGEKTYFGWKRKVVRESDSGSVVVELNRIVFNDNEQRLYGGASAWVMEGKFLIFEPAASPDHDDRVLVLGPFNTSQTTQSKNNNSKK